MQDQAVSKTVNCQGCQAPIWRVDVANARTGNCMRCELKRLQGRVRELEGFEKQRLLTAMKSQHVYLRICLDRIRRVCEVVPVRVVPTPTLRTTDEEMVDYLRIIESSMVEQIGQIDEILAGEGVALQGPAG